MGAIQHKWKDRLYMSGIFSVLASLIIYAVSFFIRFGDDGFTLFVLCYGLTLFYYIHFQVSKKRLEPEERLHHFFHFLLLFLISAYALNRSLPVFEASAGWLSVLLVLSGINYTLFAFFEQLPRSVRAGMFVFSGVSALLFLYLSAYLVPMYVIGLAGFLLLGITLHVFVPLLITIYALRIQLKAAKGSRWYWQYFMAGLLAGLLVITFYCVKWGQVNRQINQAFTRVQSGNQALPAWVQVAQHIPPTPLTEKVLKAELVYSTPGNSQGGGSVFWGIPSRQWDEPRQHDPLVMLAVLFNGENQLTDDMRIKLLRSQYSARHKSLERLWSGENLITSRVETRVKLWPECNLAYTEKLITILNSQSEPRWSGQEEAIYTFHMPEGAVVTSLSLWVNDKEEKGILTTKALADSAYKAIVGVERRDPSVVHWQEGNTVSLRVFPVLPGKSRQFKIGITAPLARKEGQLIYTDIYFDGPAYDRATEKIDVKLEQPAPGLQLPYSFVAKPGESYLWQGSYRPGWRLSVQDPGLQRCSFSFDNTTYQALPYHKKIEPAVMQQLYLDVNQAWTRKEFDQVLEAAGSRDTYVYNNGLVKLTSANKSALFSKLQQQQFSLFPLFAISHPASSLLVTKGTGTSCNLDDIDTTGFMQATRRYLETSSSIRLFNLGNKLSPYLSSLREFRVFDYDEGDIPVLANLLSSQHFAKYSENKDQVVIHTGDMMIRRTQGIQPSTGPDHLMRLFVYNHVMQQLGTGLITRRPAEDSLAEEARKAYVVTPVTSLVVLESREDYERFGIKDADNSLKNASLKGNGAVPEPHEWALIIVCLLLLLYTRKRKQKSFIQPGQ